MADAYAPPKNWGATEIGLADQMGKVLDRLDSVESRLADLEQILTSVSRRSKRKSTALRSSALAKITEVELSALPFRTSGLGSLQEEATEPETSKGLASADSPDGSTSLEVGITSLSFSHDSSSKAHVKTNQFLAHIMDDAISTSRTAFADTLWEVCFLFNLDILSKTNAWFIAFSFLLNILIQTVFTCILYIRIYGQDRIEPATFAQWRIQTGHRADMVDASNWTSLASRVCGADKSLSTATYQLGTFKDIQDYAGDMPFRAGPGLLAVAVLVWCMVVLQELWNASHFYRVIQALPRGDRTHLSPSIDEGGGLSFEISVISYGRLAGMFMVTSVRILIALALLVLGALWLAETSQVEDVVLNAVAMMFVLDVDELLFAIGLAQPTKHLYQSLHRVPLKSSLMWGVDYHPMLNFAICGGFLCAILRANYDRLDAMIETNKTLCDGNLDFAIKRHVQSGLLYSTLTTPYSQPGQSESAKNLEEYVSLNEDNLWSNAVLELINRNSSSHALTKSIYVNDTARFDALVSETMSDRMMRLSTCEDFNPGAFEGPALIATLQYKLQTNASTCEEWEAIRNSHSQSKCTSYTSVLLRATCPVTCGCLSFSSMGNPSGLFLSGEERGCPREICRRTPEILQRLREQECVDMSLDELGESAAWNSFVGQLHYFNFGNWADPQWANITNDMRTLGCGALHRDSSMEIGSAVKDYHQLFCETSAVHETLHRVCPVSCGCPSRGAASWGECPAKCREPSRPTALLMSSSGSTHPPDVQ